MTRVDLVAISKRVTDPLMEQVRSEPEGFGFVLLLVGRDRGLGVVSTSNLTPEGRLHALRTYAEGVLLDAEYVDAPAVSAGQRPGDGAQPEEK